MSIQLCSPILVVIDSPAPEQSKSDTKFLLKFILRLLVIAQLGAVGVLSFILIQMKRLRIGVQSQVFIPPLMVGFLFLLLNSLVLSLLILKRKNKTICKTTLTVTISLVMLTFFAVMCRISNL